MGSTTMAASRSPSGSRMALADSRSLYGISTVESLAPGVRPGESGTPIGRSTAPALSSGGLTLS